MKLIIHTEASILDVTYGMAPEGESFLWVVGSEEPEDFLVLSKFLTPFKPHVTYDDIVAEATESVLDPSLIESIKICHSCWMMFSMLVHHKQK